jgi:hypothetical protein
MFSYLPPGMLFFLTSLYEIAYEKVLFQHTEHEKHTHDFTALRK